jgi:hypothetical protein
VKKPPPIPDKAPPAQQAAANLNNHKAGSEPAFFAYGPGDQSLVSTTAATNPTQSHARHIDKTR